MIDTEAMELIEKSTFRRQHVLQRPVRASLRPLQRFSVTITKSAKRQNCLRTGVNINGIETVVEVLGSTVRAKESVLIELITKVDLPIEADISGRVSIVE